MKVIIAGGRTFNNGELMRQALNDLMESGWLSPDDELVCGMAPGADLLAKDIFDEAGLVVHERPADWKDMSLPCVRKTNRYGVYNALAGTKRNHGMGDESDKLVCFWNGKSTGSKDMITYMNKLGKPVHVVSY